MDVSLAGKSAAATAAWPRHDVNADLTKQT
jgi:hypothetical protein